VKAVTWSARCLVPGCDWTAGPAADPAAIDLDTRKHTGEGAYAKKPGPHHPTVMEGVAA
jgi:hypothetical protein